MDLHVVIMAAGKGTRMKSARPKVMHKVAGTPMIIRVISAAQALAPRTTTIVVGHMKELLRNGLYSYPELTYIIQEPQLGTGHALLQTAASLERKTGLVLLLSGDVPLLKSHTLGALVQKHVESKVAATVLTALVDQPYGYGRIVRVKGRISRIVEERDASPTQRKIREINSGVYVFSLGPLFDSLRGLATGNAQGEYYLTDLVSTYRRRRLGVETVVVDDPNEIRGINSRSELAEASRIVRQKKNEELMAAGVTIEDPATTYIDDDVLVGADTVIHPGVHLEGKTQVGQACEIHSGVRIINSTLGDRVTVQNHCVSRVKEMIAAVIGDSWCHAAG
jgi:bifunctional UDP-N-acetylglucosamine pyrophosphorylase/glucosamine-1-phosphate N-acetyltransferase